uniref:Uncharacterized protein n=1 Tax=Macrostomum lignano TaxID=282301 RepID=A0A1I8GFZ0_9PLAT
MPKRQECALTISSEHSDLAAASVIWFTCCSQAAAAAAAAAAAIRAGSQSICEFSGGSEENPSGTGLKRKRRSVLDSEVSNASDMPKRQECALTISSEHSDLAAASVIWFTCCSQAAAAAAAAAAAIRAGSQSICEFSGGSEENPSGTGLKRKRRSVLDSEVSNASDMPKRQECALTISSEHSDLAAASVIWFTCCSQAAAAAAAAAAAIRAGSQSICEFSGGSEENPSGTGLKRKRRSVLDSEVSNASDMPKRQECALTISSEHSDLAAASVIWFTCCSQAAAAAAAAAAAIRAGSQSICEFSGGSEENPSGTGLKRKRRSVLDSEVSNASDMPKRQECALTISSEHSDLAAASVIWFTCCSQAAAAAAAAAAAIRAGSQLIDEFSGGAGYFLSF